MPFARTDDDGGVGTSDEVNIQVVDPVRGDFNGDGFPDILWRNSANGFNRVWLMENTNYLATVFIRTRSAIDVPVGSLNASAS